MVLGHLLPSIQPQSFLEWTPTSFEQSLPEFYTIHLEEHLQVALQMLEVSKTDQSGSMIFKSGDCAGQGKYCEHFQLRKRGHRRLENLYRCSEIASGSLDTPDYPTSPRTPFQ
jgi:hypothetical protein